MASPLQLKRAMRHKIQLSILTACALAITPAIATDEPRELRRQDRLSATEESRTGNRGSASGGRLSHLRSDPISEEQIGMIDADERVTDGVVGRLLDGGDDFVELVVSYSVEPDAAMWAKVESAGGEIVRTFDAIAGYVVRIPARFVDGMLADQKITQVDWNAPMGFSMDVAKTAARVPVDNGNSGPGSTPTQHFEELISQSAEASTTELTELTGNGVTIALVDSGVRNHPDLNRLQGCVDLVQQPVYYDPLDPHASTAQLVGDINNCDENSDPFGHGTHIAGILIGDGGESNGHYRGIAPGADLISIRVLDDRGQADVGTVISGIEWAIDHKDEHGIDILSLSLGGPFYVPASDDPLVRAVEMAWDAGIVVVTSAGNLGTYGNFTITRPGNSPKIITVGSLTDWNSLDLPDDMVSSYSSKSPTLIDGYLKPDLVAPGNRIIATRAAGSSLDKLLAPLGAVFDDVYLEMSGTSMATPVVAGAIALMLENEPQLNPATVKARLMVSADAIAGSALEFGAGRLNTISALRQTATTTNAPSPRVLRDGECCDLLVDEIAGDWGAGWSATAIWGDTFIWSDTFLWGETFIWGDTALWGETFLWGETALWSDSVVQGE